MRRNPIRSIASRDKFSLARSAFSGPVLFLSTPMPPWHHCVIDIAPIHLALLFHTSRTICGSVMIGFWLPRAKLCCFSANYDSRAGTTRRYDGPRHSNRCIMKFNTFGETVFLRLPRSCRVACLNQFFSKYLSTPIFNNFIETCPHAKTARLELSSSCSTIKNRFFSNWGVEVFRFAHAGRGLAEEN